MKSLLAIGPLLAAIALPAQAQLYRWVDPDSGSVKFSSYPPPWYRDTEGQARGPAVEVIAPPRQAMAKPAAAPKPAAAERPAAAAAPAAGPLAALEARRAELMQMFSALPSTTDFNRAGSGLRQQMEAYQALATELDRLDPAGRSRRRSQEDGAFDTLRRGLEAQVGAKPSPE